MIKTAVVLITYIRPVHTSKVLEGLKNDYMPPDRLLIFHDGYKQKGDVEAWDEVERVIRMVDWCDCTVFSADRNEGLANTVICSVDKAFEENDAVIVLEDDCVPVRGFMPYMLQALNQYVNNNNVYCINGTNEPVHVPPNGKDAYFMGRINSCGWATWKDRWQIFKRDYRLLGRIKRNPSVNEWYTIWGQDIEPTVYADVNGSVDTWAAFWALNVLEQKGLCLAPFKSFINNIGFDGTGRHSKSEEVNFELFEEEKMEFVFPEKVEVIDDYETIFANYWPWTDPAVREAYYKNTLLKWIDCLQDKNHLKKWVDKRNIKSLCIWGLGEVGKRVFNELNDIVTILAIIETVPKQSSYMGVTCTDYKSIPKNIECIIVIPGYDIERIKKIVTRQEAELLVPLDNLFA